MASSRRPLLRRLAPLRNCRIRANRRFLVSSSSAAAADAPTPEEQGAVTMTESCVRRSKELHGNQPFNEGKMLRLSIEAGGCSGFQYGFSLDDKKNEDNRYQQNPSAVGGCSCKSSFMIK